MDKSSEHPEMARDLKEKAKHGDALFPLERYTTLLSPLIPEFSIHWHPEMEFTWIQKGQAAYSIDFQEYPAAQGDFICIQPGILHSAKIPFRLKLFRQLLHRYLHPALPLPPDGRLP